MAFSRFVVTLAVLGFAGALHAQAPRFHFHKGETLSYHLVQTTKVNETVVDEKTNKPVDVEATTKVDLIRNWKVVDVDGKGVATLEMSIASMRMERKAGNDEDVFDSTKPDDLNKNELAKHVGPVLAVLRIDPQGKLVEVKDSKVGPATRFATDLPFKLVLPESSPKAGDTWSREYTIQLDPPHGTGEKYAATQKYSAQPMKEGLLPVGSTIEIKDMPAQSTEQIPLLPLCPEGTIYFHPESGRYYAARLKVAKEVKNHQGDGSTYKYVSTYVEDLVPAK